MREHVMKIVQSQLAMQSEHRALTRRAESETLRAWRGERPNLPERGSARVDISDAARCREAEAVAAAQEAVGNDPFLTLVRQMIEFLTGEAVRVFDMQSFSAELSHVERSSTQTSEALQAASSGRAGWGVEYDYRAVHEEFEQTRFAASGVIRTADGQEIEFRLEFEMTRHYREETNASLRAGDAVRKDPLVINFGGTAAQLDGQAGRRFRFDLDGNGRKELLPLFASGSGYLAFDRNGNGRIDSGKELFGPQTGNGFAELARLDNDGNGWIDENDADFGQLSVWTPAADGDGQLQPLAALGIGALGLARVATPFALRGDGNADLGVVKSSGLYLNEDGSVGGMQEIDLTA
jgi:hypothetical protein